MRRGPTLRAESVAKHGASVCTTPRRTAVSGGTIAHELNADASDSTKMSMAEGYLAPRAVRPCGTSLYRCSHTDKHSHRFRSL